MESSPSFSRSDFGLIDVGVGEWNGFVFVNLDPSSAPLSVALADAPDISSYGPEWLRRGSRRDYVLTHTVWPLAVDRSSVVCEWFFAADEMERADFDPSDAVEFWDLTNLQDWKLCEGVQRGVRSRGHRPGRYQSQEDCVFFFDQWYLESME